MKSLITTFVLCVFVFFCFGQNTSIDSLKLEIKKHTKTKEEVNKVQALIELGKNYVKIKDYSAAIKVFELEIGEFSNQIHDTLKGEFIANLAIAYYLNGRETVDVDVFKQAVNSFEKSLPYIKNSKDLNKKGIIYSKYGASLLGIYENEKAIPIFEKAIDYFEKNKTLNKQWISSIGNLSGAYGNIGDNINALKYAREGKELAKKMKNNRFLAMFSLSTGESLLSVEEYELAIENFEEAVKMGKKIDNSFIIGLGSYYIGSLKMDSKKEIDWEKGKANLLIASDIFKEIQDDYYASLVNKAMAFYYENKNDYKQALALNSKYIEFLILSEDIGGQGDGFIRQGRYFGKLEQFDSARFYLQKALDIHKKDQVKESIERTYRNLSEVEELAGNHKSALAYYKQFVTYRDSIFTEKVGKTIGKESVTQNVEGAINAKKEAELQAEILSGRNRLYFAVALGLLSILLVGGYLFLQLRKTRKQLETQNIQLENQNTQLTNLNETKDRFFGIIAHDIRGPITSLDGIGEQMAYYLKKNNPERLNKLATQIDGTSKRLTNLLDNLLNWALLQKGTIPYHPKSLDIHDIVQENIELYAEVAEIKKIELKNNVKKGTLAYADLSAVTTIIRNLVNNAVKFTPENGQVLINTISKKDKIFIEINDTGTGISAERLKKIFALNTERKKGTAGEKGSGLGLILCKDLIKLNKGTIQAISELGKGSKFIFSLPLTN